MINILSGAAAHLVWVIIEIDGHQYHMKQGGLREGPEQEVGLTPGPSGGFMCHCLQNMESKEYGYVSANQPQLEESKVGVVWVSKALGDTAPSDFL